MSVFVSPTGAKFNITDRRDIILDVLQEQGYFETDLIEHASTHLSQHPGTVVDAGANIGTFCVEMANRFPNCHFHAFDPVDLSIRELEENVALNGLTNIETHLVGLSDVAGEVLGEVPNFGDSLGHISLSESADMLRRGGPLEFPRILYNVVTLDSFDLDNVTLIKADVEGMEYEVFAGAVETINRCSPMLIFEAWDTDWFAEPRTKLLNFVTSLGYTLTVLGDNVIATKS